MKSLSLIILFLSSSILSFSQNTPTEAAMPIVEEGKRLYRSEMASWYGTDLFMERYNRRENIGGYFSYGDKHVTNCIFFSREEVPQVIGTIVFDSTFSVSTAITDLEVRPFTPLEKDLYEMRQHAMDAIRTDTLFKVYENTNLNLVPLIHNGGKKVYVLCGPQVGGVVIFGNDYLLTFNADNEVVSTKQLHRNIIPIYYETKEGEVQEKTIHSHLPETGAFMTATDICTLLLYAPYTTWKTHEVLSREYLNIWNCKTNTLLVLPHEILEKISKDVDKRKKKRKRNKQ
ncbi:MAG: hypothetical protein R2824_08385 [Saprospiraceae bacterium]